MEERIFYIKKKKSLPFVKYDEDYFYFIKKQFKISWTEIKSIKLIHIRPTQRILEFKTTHKLKYFENLTTVNKLIWFFRNYYSNYTFKLELDEIEGDYLENFSLIKSKFKEKSTSKENNEKDAIETPTVFYLDRKAYLFDDFLTNSGVFLIFITQYSQRLETDRGFARLILIVSGIFLFRIIKPFIRYKENIETPYIEIGEEALYYRNKKVILPWEEIITVEDYSDMMKIKTTLNITNNLKNNRLRKFFNNSELKKNEKWIKIIKKKLSTQDSPYKQIVSKVDEIKKVKLL